MPFRCLSSKVQLQESHSRTDPQQFADPEQFLNPERFVDSTAAAGLRKAIG
jgi:hypothetical protein